MNLTTPVHDLESKPYFGGLHKGVPDSAHLIIVPGTLIEQWYRELKVFFMKHSVDIFKYPSSWKDMVQFWQPNSQFQQSEHEPSHRIILMTHAVCVITSIRATIDTLK